MRRFLPLILFGLLALVLAQRLYAPRVSGVIDSPLIGKPLPDLGIAELPEGPFIVNFFASWCTPCLLEHETLMQMHKDGIRIVGIAFHDTPEKTADYLKKHGNPFTTLKDTGGDEAGIAMGITGVPESFAVDSAGIVRMRHQGPIEDAGVIDAFRKAMTP